MSSLGQSGVLKIFGKKFDFDQEESVFEAYKELSKYIYYHPDLKCLQSVFLGREDSGKLWIGLAVSGSFGFEQSTQDGLFLENYKLLESSTKLDFELGLVESLRSNELLELLISEDLDDSMLQALSCQKHKLFVPN